MKEGSFGRPPPGDGKPQRKIDWFAISLLALRSKAHVALLFICVIEISSLASI